MNRSRATFQSLFDEALDDLQNGEPERSPRFPDRVRCDEPAPATKAKVPAASGGGGAITERRYINWQLRLKGITP